MRYAEIINFTVVNVIEAPSGFVWLYETELLSLGEFEICDIGDIYAPMNSPRFTHPNPFRYLFTAYDFTLRFTAEERAAIRLEAITNVNVADFLQLSQAAQEINTTDPTTIQAMDYLVSINLLTEARKEEILDL